MSKNMDLGNVVNEGTYDERNIPSRCTLCIMKCASFVFCFLILCSSICGKILDKFSLKRTLRHKSANSLKMSFFTFFISIYDKLNFKFFEFCYIGQCMVGEGKWYLVPSYEDTIILTRNYETRVTKG